MPTAHLRKANSRKVNAFVIEDDEHTRSAVSAALEKLGLAVQAFDNAGEALAALDDAAPKIIFLDIALNQSDAVDVIKGLGQRHYAGTVQLFSSHPRLLDAIQRIAVRYRLTVRSPLPKPLRDELITQIIAEVGLGGFPASAR
jgi:DNA-binding NtrC family response regulator